MELTPKNDVIFKMIFADPKHTRVLVHFLNSVIKPKFLIKSIEIKSTELTPEYVEKKGVRLDIVAMTNTGEIVNIEMQKKNEGDMAARSLFYWSKLFSAQLIVGGEFSELKRTISINILDFTMFQKDERYWRKGYLKDDVSNEKFTDLLEVHFIELNKLQPFDQNSPLAFWIEFFRDPYSEKMNSVYEKVPEMKEAKEIFERAKSDPEAQEAMRIYEKAAYDYGNGISIAKTKAETRD
jgi:predicted transposase/invertase (TIGR01784 family)